MTLLDVQDLRTYFYLRDGIVRAVDGVSFSLKSGETLGVVGESGCGKSVAMLSLLGLVPSPPGRVEGGHAQFAGEDLLHASPRRLRVIRGKEIAMVFQDPMTALNPYMTIGAQLIEPLQIHDRCTRREAQRRAVAALEQVGIQDASLLMKAYPHQFSGGMRQRVMIAMALITRPQFLIADEPTTALDVTVQAQILDLIKRLQAELGMAMILITHDMGVAAGRCDRVLIMYAGRIVESADTKVMFRRPRHPYTAALLAALPAVRQRGQSLGSIPGMPPDLVSPIRGCAFAPRCEKATDTCRTLPCSLLEIAPGHETACIRAQAGEL